ncbi:MAG: hypothetical protein R3228_01445 [Halioglobus sp.]|nr:hypothetical protein [Halioglobus sp.]
MTYPRLLIALILLGPLLAAAATAETPFEPGTVQVFFGALELDEQSVAWTDVSSSEVDVKFERIPVLGVEGEYILHNGWLHIGVNPGASLAWMTDDVRIRGTLSGPGGAVLAGSIDNSLWLVEAHLGGYVRGRLHDRITTYAGAGPMFMFGHHEVDDTSSNRGNLQVLKNNAADFNLGYYARAGVDFEFQRDRHLGLGVRYLSTELNFDDTVGEVDIEGPQWLFSYSQRW